LALLIAAAVALVVSLRTAKSRGDRLGAYLAMLAGRFWLALRGYGRTPGARSATADPQGQEPSPNAATVPTVPEAPATAAGKLLAPKDLTTGTDGNARVRPWIRFWARFLDTYVVALVIGFLVGVAYPPAVEWNEYLFGMALLFAYCFVEPIFFSMFGTTPGKALLAIDVTTQSGGWLSFAQAVDRSFGVWFYGWGMGIPVVSVGTFWWAYDNLKLKKTTTWDRQGNFHVSHRRIGAVRGTIATVLIVGLFALLGHLNSMAQEQRLRQALGALPKVNFSPTVPTGPSETARAGSNQAVPQPGQQQAPRAAVTEWGDPVVDETTPPGKPPYQPTPPADQYNPVAGLPPPGRNDLPAAPGVPQSSPQPDKDAAPHSPPPPPDLIAAGLQNGTLAYTLDQQAQLGKIRGTRAWLMGPGVPDHVRQRELPRLDEQERAIVPLPVPPGQRRRQYQEWLRSQYAGMSYKDLIAERDKYAKGTPEHTELNHAAALAAGPGDLQGEDPGKNITVPANWQPPTAAVLPYKSRRDYTPQMMEHMRGHVLDTQGQPLSQAEFEHYHPDKDYQQYLGTYAWVKERAHLPGPLRWKPVRGQPAAQALPGPGAYQDWRGQYVAQGVADYQRLAWGPAMGGGMPMGGVGIQRVPVSSSALRSVGYDVGAQVLEIEFHDGAVYRYYGVPADIHRGLMGADSHGRYFQQYIRGAGYRYERIE
jgi:hypothetical protein